MSALTSMVVLWGVSEEAVDITEMKVARSEDLVFMCTEGESAVEDHTQTLDFIWWLCQVECGGFLALLAVHRVIGGVHALNLWQHAIVCCSNSTWCERKQTVTLQTSAARSDGTVLRFTPTGLQSETFHQNEKVQHILIGVVEDSIFDWLFLFNPLWYEFFIEIRM